MPDYREPSPRFDYEDEDEKPWTTLNGALPP
jgi:hypothetical protein